MVHNLEGRLKSGAMWTFFGYGFQKALQLSSSLVLTRILFPEDFGLMSLVNVFILGLMMLSDVGITPAIVQMKHNGDSGFLNTAWTIQVIRGWVLWIILCALAYPISLIYSAPELFSLLIFCGITSVVTGYKSINVVLASRNLQVKSAMLVQVAGQLVCVLSMIGLALWLRSVWALAIGTVVGVVVEVLVGHYFLKGHKHSLCFDKETALSLLHFGKWIFFSTLLFYLGGQGGRAVQGVVVSIEELGIIAIAATISMIPGELIQQAMAKLVFPSLSMTHRENPSAFTALLKSFRWKIILAAMPMFLLTSLFSTSAINFLYEERYAFAGPILSIMVLGECAVVLAALYKNAFLSLGLAKLHFQCDFGLAVLRITGMIVGFYLGGVVGMFLGILVGAITYLVFVTIFAYSKGFVNIKVDASAFLFFITVGLASLYVNVF